MRYQTKCRACSEDEGAGGMQLAHASDPHGPWARNADVPEPVRRAAMAQHARDEGAQTGVKGVLKDYKDHQAQQQMQVTAAYLCANVYM